MNTESYYFVSPYVTGVTIDINRNGTQLTHNMNTPMYNSSNIQVGSMQSVGNAWYTNAGKNVTSLTTFITPNGVIVCNLFYITNKEYFVGNVTTTPTFASGIYADQDVTINLIGNSNGTRQLTITY